ncbi:MAG: hypothetical protein IKO80_08180, partial [Lachnospiraceae bacterium]|nr:hypothetical protein [Lachnospiraceae bacterium]
MNGSKGSMKRLLTGLLAAALVTASFPSTVFAAGSITDPVAAVPEGSVTDPAADPGSGGVENPAPEEDPEITLPTEGEEPAETQDPTDGEEPASPEEPVESSDALTDPIDETEDGLTSAADGEETEEEADALIPVLSEEEPERVGGKYGSGDGVITSDAGSGGYQFKFAKVGYQKDDIEQQTATLTNNGTKTLTLQDPVTLTDSAKGYWEFGPFLVNGVESKSLPAG